MPVQEKNSYVKASLMEGQDLQISLSTAGTYRRIDSEIAANQISILLCKKSKWIWQNFTVINKGF